MAREVILRDDIDGSYEEVETVLLAWDGTTVEIDLSAENRTVVAEFLTPYLKAGRKPARTSAPTKPGGRVKPSKAEAEQRATVRAWAATNGIPVVQRGPIPESILAQYDAAMDRTE